MLDMTRSGDRSYSALFRLSLCVFLDLEEGSCCTAVEDTLYNVVRCVHTNMMMRSLSDVHSSASVA